LTPTKEGNRYLLFFVGHGKPSRSANEKRRHIGGRDTSNATDLVDSNRGQGTAFPGVVEVLLLFLNTIRNRTSHLALVLYKGRRKRALHFGAEAVKAGA